MRAQGEPQDVVYLRTTPRPAIGPMAWHVLASLIVFAGPSALRLGTLPWSLPPPEMVQSLVWAACFLLYSLVAAVDAGGIRRLGPRARLLVLVVVFAGGQLFLAANPELAGSRWLAAMALTAGAVLALMPVVGRPAKLAGAVVIAAGLATGAARVIDARGQGLPRTTIETATGFVRTTVYEGLVGPVHMDGGAIDTYRSGYVLVTGDGRFYQLTWRAQDSLLVSRRLDVARPFDLLRFFADHRDDPHDLRLRVTDLMVEIEGGDVRLIVAHQRWHPDPRCFSMAVSERRLSWDLSPVGPDWTRVFESEPCLPASMQFDDIETGGRLARHPDGGLLLSVGDHGFDGRPGRILAQDPGSSYGKILHLLPGGGSEVFSLGHRNPQGLLVDREGRVWSTEHGPRGGDEINRVEEGQNFGWPFATYGTEYGTFSWPMERSHGSHAEFAEPAQAFLPAVGISNLIEVRANTFNEWGGDLLIATLRAGALLRLRERADQIVFIEPIDVGRRIRDLTEGADGRIVMWIDEGAVMVLEPAPASSAEGYMAMNCSGCHGTGRDATAPTLRRVVGREIASAPGFAYSEALRRVGGRWSERRLGAFLRDPAGFAPGNRMPSHGIEDAQTRRALVGFLKNYR